MSAILDILNPTNTISVNRPLAAVLGLNAAVIYSALLSKSSYYSEHEMLDDGWFYSTIEDLNESTLLTGRQQSTAIKKLVETGLIKCKRRGLPAKRYFYINNDVELLKEIVTKGEQNLKKIKPTAYIASKKTENYVEYSENEYVAEETDIVTCNECNSSNAKISNKNRHTRNSCSDKNTEHTYYNPKGIKTKENVNQSIAQSADMIDTIDSNAENKPSYLDAIKENIGYDYLCETYKGNKDYVDEIVLLIADIASTNRKTIRVCGEDKPAEMVKSVFLKLDESHIQYVVDSMRENTTKVRNIRNYLITALYNAKFTLNSYYRSLVNHDMYGKPCDGGVQ